MVRKVSYVQHKPFKKNIGESGGHSPFSYEKPNPKIEWVQNEQVPMLRLLTEIRDELKKLNAK